MKLILLLAIVLTALLYGCATQYNQDSGYYGYYGYEQPNPYPYQFRDYYLDYSPPLDFYPDAYRYSREG